MTGTKEYKEQIKKDFQASLTDLGFFTYSDNGFGVEINGHSHSIAWTGIQALFGYKVDLYTLDEIRMDVFCDDDILFTISEETPGWYVFLKKIEEQFPAIKQNWNLEIAFPAFSANLTLLYEKHNKTFDEAIDYYYKKN
ncbi:hypothetical protein NAT51_14000 [Flavobacterium amniphilum]|uniref:hypothetical protein n=1 Tax=Flavobacterium amniphilum TaxID=1834035 RepID=UPI00202A689C|nr:hypothetical protein [Flavobacterium amniphilum]MCL9806644.1 hypothetical protein [Flavobacterium amniphilum]